MYTYITYLQVYSKDYPLLVLDLEKKKKKELVLVLGLINGPSTHL